MFITESWLKSKGDEAIIKAAAPTGYVLKSYPRLRGRGGGIAIIYRSYFKIDSVRTLDQNTASLESAAVVLHHRGMSTHFICLYHPPPSKKNKATPSSFIDEFKILLETIDISCSNPIIVGDFNVHFDDKNDANTKRVTQLLQDHNFQQCNNYATHKSGHILDWVIARTQSDQIKKIQVQDKAMSDHHVILCNTSLILKKPNKCNVLVRNLKRIDLESLKQDIITSTLSSSVPISIKEHCEQFQDFLVRTTDKHAPLEKRAVSMRQECPWYTSEVHLAKLEKRIAERRWRKSQLTVHREIYVCKKNLLKKTIRHAKADYIKSQIEQKARNPRAMANLLSSMLGYKDKSSPLPTKPNGRVLADKFQTYFREKIEKIRASIPPTTEAEEAPISQNYELQDLSHFHLEELRKIILSMKPTSCELDDMPTRLLLQCLDAFLPIIADLVNHSLQSGEFPHTMKKAIVRPLLKKPNLDTNELGSYRPVSNLSFISKIIEKAASVRLCSFLNSNNMLPKFQSAYRSGHSTETALLRVLNDIRCAVDNGRVALVTLLDLSAAFDTIDHNILLSRLKKIGISSTPLKWLQSYLSGRTQRVVVEGVASSEIDTVVPPLCDHPKIHPKTVA